jgi:hypothetical protein
MRMMVITERMITGIAQRKRKNDNPGEGRAWKGQNGPDGKTTG